MSRTQCPDCPSSDGLALYEDGTYCHACKIVKKHDEPIQLPKKKELVVPKDNWVDGPPEIYAFLSVYNIYSNIQHDHNVYWSPEYKRIVFPYQDFAWMRSLTEKPKWLYAGPKPQPELYYLQHNYSLSLVLCEDVISAIRINEYAESISLMGTTITQHMEFKLLEIINNGYIAFVEIILWLDGDEAGVKARTILKKQLQKITDLPIRIIRSKQDPKSFDSKTIKEILSI